MNRRLMMLGALGVLLAACGRKGPLQPPPGSTETAAELEADDRATAGSVEMDQASEQDP